MKKRVEYRAHKSWSEMIQRCRNPKNHKYPRYGGRGISVCERWLEFTNFLADMGERPEGRYSLDRIDNDGNYEPGNCRWATDSQQMLNRRGCRRVVKVDGRELDLVEAAKVYGIKKGTLWLRLKNGWPHDVAVKLPILQACPPRK